MLLIEKTVDDKTAIFCYVLFYFIDKFVVQGS